MLLAATYCALAWFTLALRTPASNIGMDIATGPIDQVKPSDALSFLPGANPILEVS